MEEQFRPKETVGGSSPSRGTGIIGLQWLNMTLFCSNPGFTHGLLARGKEIESCAHISGLLLSDFHIVGGSNHGVLMVEEFARCIYAEDIVDGRGCSFAKVMWGHPLEAVLPPHVSP